MTQISIALIVHRQHAKLYPFGCPLMCEACTHRIDGEVSPFTTPGTRLTWASGAEWAARFRELHARISSTVRYVNERDHYRKLSIHRAFIQAQPHEDLVAILDLLTEQRHNSQVTPVRGNRKGSPYEIILVETRNALARLTKPVTVRGEVHCQGCGGRFIGGDSDANNPNAYCGRMCEITNTEDYDDDNPR